MRKIFQVLCVWVMTVNLLSSCLSNDSSEVTLYDDVAVTAFTLGTLNRQVHTISSTGKDSVYKVTFAGSGYVMAIDQVNRKIFNVQLLPQGTDIAHVLCTVTTRNSGTVTIKSLTSDSLTYYQATDSIDFTKPRILRIFSSSGEYCDYEVTLNVRQVSKGQLLWTELPAGTELPQIPTTGWDFQLSDDGQLLARDTRNSGEWVAEALDTSAGLLPQTNLAFTSWQLDEDRVYALLVGDNDAVSSTAAVVWRKVIDRDHANQWVYMPLSADNNYYLPKGQRYYLLPLSDGTVFAVSKGGTFYQSRDQGITWKTSAAFALPSGFSGNVADAMTDAEGALWLVSEETGAVWRATVTE